MTRGKRKPLAKVGWRAKAQVYGTLTSKEVCRGWHRHYKSVLGAIQSGNIHARKAGGTWLISYRSVVAWWGKPLEAQVYMDTE